MILIADSGSTKTHWVLVDGKTRKHSSVFTNGINPYYQTTGDIFAEFQANLVPKLNAAATEQIHFYGAGCSKEANRQIVKDALNKIFPNAMVHVDHDLLAAARATCGAEAGIACILGTGSNSCLYNGEKIIDHIPSLGFILGDEGSGAWFGRKLLQTYYYREIPLDLHTQLESQFDMNKDIVLESVYKKPLPNRYMGRFAKFLSTNADHTFIKSLLEKGFHEFIEKIILKYPDSKNYPVHFVGSWAYYNKVILGKTLRTFKLNPGRFLQSPMEGLLKFHLNKTEP